MSEATATAPQPAQTSAEAAKKKGGYHYWHSHEKERALVGDVAPKLTPKKVHDAEIEFDAVASLKKVNITTYSWCDNTKTVNVYVDFKGVGTIEPEKINTKYTDKSLRLSVENDGKDHVLVLHLSKAIDGSASTHKVKPDQLVFRLVKANEETWFDLTGAAASNEDDE